MSKSLTESRPKRRDPAIIQSAPTAPDPANIANIHDKNYLQMIGVLSSENESLKAENESLKQHQAFELAKAQLVTPFSNKIFFFVVGYCVFMGVVILLSGFPANFRLADSVLTTLVGSTAVAVLALIGSVVTGLFKKH